MQGIFYWNLFAYVQGRQDHIFIDSDYEYNQALSKIPN